MSIMNTYTGKKFDPLQMKPEDVDLVDIPPGKAVSYQLSGDRRSDHVCDLAAFSA